MIYFDKRPWPNQEVAYGNYTQQKASLQRQLAKRSLAHLVREVTIAYPGREIPQTRSDLETGIKLAEQEFIKLAEYGVQTPDHDWYIYESRHRQRLTTLARVAIIDGTPLEWFEGAVPTHHPDTVLYRQCINGLDAYSREIGMRLSTINLQDIIIGSPRLDTSADEATNVTSGVISQPYLQFPEPILGYSRAGNLLG